ncbi:MAG: peptide ABC transporter substrate-binding protein [Candidatus Sedimenticola endophacoides]|uniref:Peptide ABC transporter substrate-binding protein n=3 Tax=Candidatus Sedimenticola endophacoides TaxID=2548426 RepID=A0A6N4DXX2_9GAMM|nr:MAG: peptide ABC transporter substrate-binding protein [Candidatus Sedimenticola endophacoides]OQX35726.1 MAG: peptide ABC transporter substrate-binding protein [Candidatus Sedimenticola endophacoides]OQX40997.1 MAG: peptide ABC transporter substrate-binding protein [Candidatus Sedimenticola endophacoides]PUD99383.1 MAG: peptide ABC transporter substrate-binding protein [Candidatus Sedimenticola endophacoides]PUE02187.1 MAG: peptide ABC transporter substrate-binding protein [Candidatus Sedim
MDFKLRGLIRLCPPAALILLLSGCGGGGWNNPYPASERESNVLYSSFSERPKHLDPVRSYSANEYAFIAQVYEPPLQYHFLKRPYDLIPLAAEAVPEAIYLDAAGQPLGEHARDAEIVFSEYQVRIRPGMRYQPHPAFALDDRGGYRYHALTPEQVRGANTLTDFSATGSREVTAEDFVHQIKRLAAPWLHSPIAGVMGEYIVGFNEFGERVGGAHEARKASSGREQPYFDLRDHALEGVEVIDRHRFRVRLKGKYPQFVYWLAMPFFAPMPWEAEAFYGQPGMEQRNITLNWYPLGSGPFMLTENNPNLRMVLARNPNYHGERYPAEGEAGDRAAGLLEDAGAALPFIDRAVYSLEKESIPYWNKFLQGYYDTSGVSSDSFDQAVRFSEQGELGLAEALEAKGIRLQEAVTTSIYYMGFNMGDPVVGGDAERARLLRRAISIAVDFEEYISIFNNGRGIAAQGPLPPGIFGSHEGDAAINPYIYQATGTTPRRRPLEQARELLERAGYPGGRDAATGKALILYYDTTASGPDDKARLNWMRKQFTKLGIQLVIRATDYNRFQEKMREGNAQIFMWGWNADYPDPENFLFLLYGPNGKVAHGGENAANYANPRFDALFERMKNMSNGPERQAIIDQMVEIARRDAPWHFGFHPKAVSLFHGWYRNVKPNLMANNTLKYKRLLPGERARMRTLWNPPVLWPFALLVALLVLSALPAVRLYRRHERSAAR